MSTLPTGPNGYAIVVPVGAAPIELVRLVDLFDAVCHFEPNLRCCVLLDNAPASRHLERIVRLRRGETISLLHSHRETGHVLLGSGCAGMLAALQTIAQRGIPDYVLRLDSDAMIIGPFDRAVRRFIDNQPRAGMIGAVGKTCRRDWPGYGSESCIESSLIKMARDEASLLNRLEWTSAVYQWDPIRETRPAAANALRGLASIRAHICRAIEHGYSTLEYCQGGGYVLTPEFVRRMAQRGYLDSAGDWASLPVAEDVMIGMYVRAVGLEVRDFSNTGEPFGTHFRGLAYPPPRLLSRRYAIVHSVRNNPAWSEDAIRAYFKAHRTAEPARDSTDRAS